MADVKTRLRQLRQANQRPSLRDRLQALRDARPSEPEPQKTAGQEAEEMLGIDPTLDRGSILPLARTQGGDLTLALPQFAVDAAKSVMLPGQVAAPIFTDRPPVEVTERDVTRMALDVAPTRGLQAGVAAKRPQMRRYLAESPPAEQLKTEGLDLKRRAEQQGIEVDPQAMADFAIDLRQTMDKEFPSDRLYGRSRNLLNEWEDKIKAGQPVGVDALEIMRREAKDAASSPDPVENKAAVELINAVDDFMDNLDATKVVSQAGDPASVSPLLKQYRNYYTRQAKINTLSELAERAAESPQGLEGGLRVELRNFVKNKRRTRGWTKAELDRLKQIQRGDVTQKFLRFASNFGLPAGGSNRVIGTTLGALGGLGIGQAMGFPELGAGGGALSALGVIGSGNLAGRGAISRTQRDIELARSMLSRGQQYPRVQPAGEAIARQLVGPVVGSGLDTESGPPLMYSEKGKRMPTKEDNYQDIARFFTGGS